MVTRIKPDPVIIKPKSLTLKKCYINAIRDGIKTIEGRIFTGPAKNVKIGQKVRFYYYTNARDDVTCRVVSLARYATFKHMLEHCSFAACVPQAKNREDAVAIYNSIPGYREKQAKFGVIAIGIERL